MVIRTKKVEEKLDAKVGYPFLIFKQIDRINEAMTLGEIDAYARGIEALEIAVWNMIVRNPEIEVFDEKGDIQKITYKEYLDRIEQDYKQSVDDLKKGRSSVPYENTNQAVIQAYLRAKAKHKALVILLDYLGLLPEVKRAFREGSTGSGTSSGEDDGEGVEFSLPSS